MEITAKTKLKDIIAQYPWVIDEAIKLDSRLEIANTMFGKMLLKKVDIQTLADHSDEYSADDIIRILQEKIQEREGNA